jgi:hypothetical protein
LQKIIGKKIQKVDCVLPALDLAVQFNNSLVLRIFCDRTNPSEDDGNYVFFTSKHTYAVGIASRLRRKGVSRARNSKFRLQS